MDTSPVGLRTQGRPRADRQQFDRNSLLAKIRETMKRPPRIDLQRRDIAELAGISPALVNYYFPDKWEMLEAAALPIINNHVAKVVELIESDDESDVKLKKLIHLYVAFNRDSGYLVDYYAGAMTRLKTSESISMLWAAHAKVLLIIRQAIDDGHIRDVSPDFVNALIWSVCKYVAQHSIERGARFFPNRDGEDLCEVQADTVHKLLIKGLKP